MVTIKCLRLCLCSLFLISLSACTIGPEFKKPGETLPDEWSAQVGKGLEASPIKQSMWWLVFDDPELNQLLEIAWKQNNSLEIAGLRVLEAQAQLGIATGNRYPQSQVMYGDATRVSPANHAGGGANFTQYNLGVSAAWELDFWGRFRRGIESADATFLASIAARDQVLILLTAQVVDTYAQIRIAE